MRNIAACWTPILLSAALAVAEEPTHRQRHDREDRGEKGCVSTQDELARDSEHLKQLAGEVRSRLPQGWQVYITPDIPRDVETLGSGRAGFFDQPCLVVRRSGQTPGRFAGANPSPDEPFKPVGICFLLTVSEFLSPDEYRKKEQGNAQHIQRRTAVEEPLRKSGMPWRFRGNLPIPPSAFEPRTPDEKEHVRQYALLWMRTHEQPLPTHYYNTLSLTVYFDEELELKDPAIASERKQLRGAILRMITPYVKNAE